MRFATAMVKLFPKLLRPHPPIPRPDVVPSALETFRSMGDGFELCEVCVEAGLAEVFTYLRGGKHLKVPPHWQSEIPHKL